MTTSKPAPTTLVVRRVVPFPRERVFDAWLDPKRLALFMRPASGNRTIAEVDPRVGGKFRIVMFHPKSPPGGNVHTGEYLLIDRPSRLSFTWISASTENRATTVTVDFLERDGGTEVVITHVDLAERQVEGHREGWSQILSLLDGALGRG